VATEGDVGACNKAKNALVHIGYLVQRDENESGYIILLQWQHDLIWQTAYSLIPHQEQPAWHVSIGRTLLRLLSPTQVEETMFLIRSQWS
jgi:predicted ATPase